MSHRLPVEVVTHVMRFLSLSDRKEAALVCRNWYDASLDPILQQDIIIHFHGSSASSNSRAVPHLSKRRLPHLVIDDVDTTFEQKAVIVKSCEHLAANLKSLSLKSSNITESSLVELLSRCTHLVSLDLSCCNSLFMSGQILERNSDIQALRSALINVIEVNLSSIRFLSDATFNRIMMVCENVERLSLASVPVSFSTSGLYYPRGTTKCANGAVLTFSNIKDFVLVQQCLTSLNFSRTQIGDSDLEEIVSTPGLLLQDLILVSCRNLSDEGIVSICKYQPGLSLLDIRECADLTNGSVMAVGVYMKQLKSLYLNKCRQISDKSIGTLSSLGQLSLLDVSECFQVTSAGLVKGLCTEVTSHLTHLNLNCCSNVGDVFVEKACFSLPWLTHLDLGSCFPVTNKSVLAISSNLKYLRYLRLAWCKEVSDHGLMGLYKPDSHHQHADENGECKCSRNYNSKVIFRKPTDKAEKEKEKQLTQQLKDLIQDPVTLSNLAGIRYLDLTACKKLTGAGLAQTIKFPELRVLHLGMLPELTDEGIITIVKNNPSIEELNLSQSATLTDAAVDVIATRLLRLQTLNVFGCDKLTDRSVHVIQKNCARLRHIDVSFCSGITIEAMEKLETSLKFLLTVQKRMIGSV